MNHRHRKILHSLFSHPLPNNIHLHDVETVLREMGAEVDRSYRAWAPERQIQWSGRHRAWRRSRLEQGRGREAPQVH